MWLGIGRFWRKLRSRGQQEQLYREMVEELELHAALKLREHTLAGLASGEANMQTRRDMGNVLLASEQSADLRSFLLVEHVMQDIRYALRLFRKNPGFSLIAVLSLALGIAGNTAVFSLVNALLIKPLPFANPSRLVRITSFYPQALLVYFQQRSHTMEVAAVSPGVEWNVTGQGPAFRILASAASANLFSVLGVSPRIGRGFEPGEDHPGRDGIAILSDEVWRSQFGADPAIVGRVIEVNGTPRRIVGIMPPGFAFPSARVQLWFPDDINPTKTMIYWGGEFVPLIGRLRDGVTIGQAQAEVHALAANVWTMFPFPMPRSWNADSTVISLQTDLAGDSRGRLLMLLCAVGAVLVIACANVASLLLARATTRSREMALRAALGAGRMRIVRQLLTESVVLAGGAGIVGLALGSLALGIFSSVVSPGVPAVARISIDWNVAAFAGALSMLTGLSFGLVPALGAARMNLIETVKAGSQRSGSGTWIRLRSWLIAGEIALTLILVIGAALLIKSLNGLSHVNPGFDTRRVLAMKISPDSSFCAQRSACVAFYDELVNQARGVSGVMDVALANTIPLDDAFPAVPADVEDHPKTATFPAPMLWLGAVTPGYLRLMEIPLLAGRALAGADGPNSEPVILIDASTAKRFWPAGNAIGKHIRVVTEKRWRTIVGIVADVRQFNLANRTPSRLSGAMYMPYTQSVQVDQTIPAVMHLIVKTGHSNSQVDDELYRLAKAKNPNIPVGKVVHLGRLAKESIADFRSTAWIFLTFAAVALILAAIGIYGLVSYSVTQRTYEISLRMAIGASNGGIVRMILSQSLRIAVLGMVVGLAGALVLTRLLTALLFDVAPADPLVYAGVSVLLFIVAAAASSVPAWRASRIDPIRTLRAE